MKILFITETFPYPLDSGGKIATYQLLQTVSRKHSVHLVAPVHKNPKPAFLRALPSHIKVTTVIDPKRNVFYTQPKSELLRSVFSLKPFFISLFESKPLKAVVDNLLASEKFDVIHIDHIGMAQYLPKKKKHLWILSTQNIEHHLQADIHKITAVSVKARFFFRYNALTLKSYEQNVVRVFDQIIALTDDDKSALVSLGVRPEKILVVPPYGQPTQAAIRQKPDTLLFIGNLWWKPNADAVEWFITKIFPLIREARPRVQLNIIGERKKEFILPKNPQSAVHIHGKVDDLKPFLNATASILPIRIGGGVRIKALTAFENGLPVVSTTAGMKGLSAVPEKHYLLADTPESFAHQTIRLLNDPALQKSLRRNALMLLSRVYNKKTIQHSLLRQYGKTND